MGKMGQYVLEHPVDDPNELREGERVELDDWLDMVNELLAEKNYDGRQSTDPR